MLRSMGRHPNPMELEEIMERMDADKVGGWVGRSVGAVGAGRGGVQCVCCRPWAGAGSHEWRPVFSPQQSVSCLAVSCGLSVCTRTCT